mgnify:FL=1
MNAPTATHGTYPSTHNEARARWSLDAACVVLGLASLRGDEALRGAVRAYLCALVSWMETAALWGASTVAFKGEALAAQRAAWEGAWHLFHDVTLDAGTDPGAQAHELVGGAVFVATGFTPRDLVDIVATMEHPTDRGGHLEAVRYLLAACSPGGE